MPMVPIQKCVGIRRRFRFLRRSSAGRLLRECKSCAASRPRRSPCVVAQREQRESVRLVEGALANRPHEEADAGEGEGAAQEDEQDKNVHDEPPTDLREAQVGRRECSERTRRRHTVVRPKRAGPALGRSARDGATGRRGRSPSVGALTTAPLGEEGARRRSERSRRRHRREGPARQRP